MARPEKNPIRPGQRFGFLTAIVCVGLNEKSKQIWECRCDCGATKQVVAECLKRPGARGTRSCGCAYKGTILAREHHGLSNSLEFAIYRGIIRRCEMPNEKAYPEYGAKGIRMCDGWRRSPRQFVDDMGPRPSVRHSVDRKDGAGHYSCGKCSECVANGWPMNCRWATPKEQARNRRSNRRVTINGVTKTVAEWAESAGIGQGRLRTRLNKGVAPECLLLPPQPSYPPLPRAAHTGPESVS